MFRTGHDDVGRVSLNTLVPAPVHPVIVLQMTDDRLDGCPLSQGFAEQVSPESGWGVFLSRDDKPLGVPFLSQLLLRFKD